MRNVWFLNVSAVGRCLARYDTPRVFKSVLSGSNRCVPELTHYTIQHVHSLMGH